MLRWLFPVSCINIKISQSILYRNNELRTLSVSWICWFYLPDYMMWLQAWLWLHTKLSAFCQSVEMNLKPRQQTIEIYGNEAEHSRAKLLPCIWYLYYKKMNQQRKQTTYMLNTLTKAIVTCLCEKKTTK